jgi:hypothetical protein
MNRFLDRAEVIQITGKSYRLKEKACAKKNSSAKQKSGHSGWF